MVRHWAYHESEGHTMAIESTGHSQGNPRLYELVENAPKTGKSPTIWAWPEVIDFFRVAGQPVPGPWPPHQQRRPDPEEESLPTAVPDPQSASDQRPTNERSAEQGSTEQRPAEQGSPAAPMNRPRHYLDEPADSDHQGRGYLDDE